jgi:hypothetical protein
MKTVNQKEYRAAVRKHPEWEARPIEGYTFSAMMYLDDKGTAMASATYSQPIRGQKVIVTYMLKD